MIEASVKMTPEQERFLDNAADEFRAWGYMITYECIPGCESLFLHTLNEGLNRIRQQISFNARRYNLRGRSKKAIAYLNQDLPRPCDLVELRMI